MFGPQTVIVVAIIVFC